MSSNPLDNIDFTAPEFKAGVENLADFLHVTKVTVLSTSLIDFKYYPDLLGGSYIRDQIL